MIIWLSTNNEVLVRHFAFNFVRKLLLTISFKILHNGCYIMLINNVPFNSYRLHLYFVLIFICTLFYTSVIIASCLSSVWESCCLWRNEDLRKITSWNTWLYTMITERFLVKFFSILLTAFDMHFLKPKFQQFIPRIKWTRVTIMLIGTVCIIDQVTVVGTGTLYGLDGPGNESRWGRNFPHPSRPVLELA
jgi:hypothetical protein